MPAQPAITIDTVSKSFGGTRALTDLSLSVPSGSFFALLGPSGCGKTTLMRLIAGFERPDKGKIFVDGADMARVPPERRPVNMMFQSYALFPHMSVAQNIGYGLQRAGYSRSVVRKAVGDLLQLVKLDGFGRRRPDQLSGGQRQRVALARALARRPRILLLDEPMAALDRKLRGETQFALKDIQRTLGTTFVLVTHDQDEAMGLADTVALMRDGRIEQVGAPVDLYEKPASLFVAGFIGETNVIEGTVLKEAGELLVVDTRDGELMVPANSAFPVGTDVSVAIRPERLLTVNGPPGANARNVFSGTIHDATFRGATTLLRVMLPSGTLLRVALQGAQRTGIEKGAPIVLRCPAQDMRLLDG